MLYGGSVKPTMPPSSSRSPTSMARSSAAPRSIRRTCTRSPPRRSNSSRPARWAPAQPLRCRPAPLNSVVRWRGGGAGGRSSFEAYLALAALRPAHAHIAYGPDYVDAAHRLARVAIERLGCPASCAVRMTPATRALPRRGRAYRPARTCTTPTARGCSALRCAAFALTRARRWRRPPRSTTTAGSCAGTTAPIIRSRRSSMRRRSTSMPSSRSAASRGRASRSAWPPATRGSRGSWPTRSGAFHTKPHQSAGAMLHELARRLRDEVRSDADGAVRDWPNGRFFEDLVRHFLLRSRPSTMCAAACACTVRGSGPSST